MKKLLLALVVVVAMCFPVQAAYRSTHIKLKDSTGTAIVDLALSNGVAVYSQKIETKKNAGFFSLLITEDKAGGAGDVDISLQYSIDGTNWYDAYVSDMDGTINIEGVASGGGLIVSGLQDLTRWIVYTARAARYMRYKFDPDADSQITATHIYVEDR